MHVTPSFDRRNRFTSSIGVLRRRMTPLGYARIFTSEEAIGYGYPGQNDLLLLNLESYVNVPGKGFHLAFAALAPEHAADFHAAALKHGGQCNGYPGPRPDYGDHYYAAFVIDPEAIGSKPCSITPNG